MEGLIRGVEVQPAFCETDDVMISGLVFQYIDFIFKALGVSVVDVQVVKVVVVAIPCREG